MPKDWTGNKPTAFVQMGASSIRQVQFVMRGLYGLRVTITVPN